MNNFQFLGRLTKDPELKYTFNEKSYCKFSVAVDRRFKKDDGPTADFFFITAWGKQADVITQYFKKGQQILIEGRIENNNWEDENGKKHYDFEFTLEHFDFAAPAKNSKNTDQDVNNNLDDLGDPDFKLMEDDNLNSGEFPF